MYTLDDTIAAISTPLGYGGIGIVRLSGPEALPVARRLFARWAPGTSAVEPHRLYHGHIVSPETRRPVDEVLVSYMPAPHSYTRQDVVEINAHGGPAPLREILALCLRHGARPARPGEFTLRAFLHGRLDLAQAEAVRDVIQARTEASLRVALGQLGGRLSGEARALRARLLRVQAYLAAGIDYPDEDLPEEEIAGPLDEALAGVEALLADASRGLIYRQGVRVAILGRPNVGKSSLLNRLLQAERAIVTPIPGTTRDTLEETIDLDGIPVVLVDTAGIGAPRDVVERLGVERSGRAAACADLVLLVVDGSARPSAEDEAVAGLACGRRAIVVVNKDDLPSADDYAHLLPGAPHMRISAATGGGVRALEAALAEAILSGGAEAGDEPLVSDPRHRDLLARAAESLRAAREVLAVEGALECVAVDVGEAVAALGEITGETAGEDLLETIFRSFCIGK